MSSINANIVMISLFWNSNETFHYQIVKVLLNNKIN